MASQSSVRAAVARILDPPSGSGWTPPAGAVVALRTPEGEFIHADGYRVPAAAGQPPAAMTPTTVHDLASVTKTVTTTAVLRLAAENRIDLDDDVRAYVPTFSHPATLRQLLLHRAGLWEWWPLYVPARVRAAAYAVLDALPPRYPAGSGRHYSDLGFMLLARVVEAATGTDLPTAFGQLVTSPLRLSTLGFGPRADPDIAASSFGDAAEQRMLATSVPYPVPYSASDMDRWREGLVIGEANDGNAYHALVGVSGHAGMFASVPDVLTFAHTLCAGEHDLWSPDATATLFADGPDEGQALGWRTSPVRTDGGLATFVYHPGFTGTLAGFVPGRGIAVAVAANRLVTAGEPMPTDQLRRIMLDLVEVAGPIVHQSDATRSSISTRCR